MEITFDKRVYNIVTEEDRYEVTHIVKHPIKEFDNDSYFVLKYHDSDVPEFSGYRYCEVSREFLQKIKEVVKDYENPYRKLRIERMG